MALTRDEIQARIDASDGPVDLSGLDLRGADLSRLDLRGARLARADLSSADLRWAVLEGADLQATVLRRVDARWAVLRGASLRQADLTRANLGWSDLGGADLSAAELEGAMLDNVDLGEVVVDRPQRSGARRAPLGSGALAGVGRGLSGIAQRLPGGAALPAISPATLAAGALAMVVLVQLWGWLYHRAYFLRGFDLHDANIVQLLDGGNLFAGLVHVVGMTLLLLLLSPVILLAAVLVLAAILVVPLAFYALTRRLLRDVVRSPGRPLVIGGLFIAFFVVFYLLIPEAVAAASGFGAALPEGGRLSTVTELWLLAGWLRRLGLLAVLLGALYPVWLLLRWGLARLRDWNVPAAWRLRYPALNAGVVNLRAQDWVRAAAAPDEVERRQGLWAVAGLLALLATLLTGIGEVHAYRDMCDGGELPRVQAYATLPDDEQVEPMLSPRGYCSRLLAETDDAYYVFFPCRTSPGARSGTREAAVHELERDTIGLLDRTISEHDCPTCADGCLGTELRVVDPLEEHVYGPLLAADPAAGLLELDANALDFEGMTAWVRVDPQSTRLLLAGEPITLDEVAEVLEEAESAGAALYAEAFGRFEGDASGGFLDATRGRVFDPAAADDEAGGEVEGAATAPAVPPGGSLTVDLSDPRNPTFIGEGWQPNQALQVSIIEFPQGGDPSNPSGEWPIGNINAGSEDGSFNAPITFNPQWPTGDRVDPDTGELYLRQVKVTDPRTGQTTIYENWLAGPPPTPTPVPTPIPTIVREDTPAPTDDPNATATATATTAPTFTPVAPPTNTPFPNISGRPAPGIAPTCDDPDDFEFDDGRGFQKEIQVGLGTGNAVVQSRNFCSPFDIDLAYFPVKAGRWYRVFTQSLGPGVDTVMAVGDLAPDTYCEPFHPTWGCWSDDRATLSFESEIVFQARADQTAIITVDNRGSGFGSEATYELGVEMFEPDSTATPTLFPTETATATRTPTRTPTPEKDAFELDGDVCSPKAPVIQVGQVVRALLENDSDDDYFLIDLEAGVRYRATLTPPGDADYDLEILFYAPIGNSTTRANCNVYASFIRDGGEDVRFSVPETGRYALRVYTQREADRFRTYRLLIDYDTTQLPSATPPPSATTAPSATPVPTATRTPRPTPTFPPLLPRVPATATATATAEASAADLSTATATATPVVERGEP